MSRNKLPIPPGQKRFQFTITADDGDNATYEGFAVSFEALHEVLKGQIHEKARISMIKEMKR